MQAAVAPDPSPRAVPFLKWAGSKRQLLPELLKRVPEKYGTYYEPFLGGGSLFFALQPERAVLSDLNERLIRTYRSIRDNLDDVMVYLKSWSSMHCETFYYGIRQRSVDQMSDPEVAAWFIYMNKAGFNGLYRVNKAGKFNVPWGKHEKFVVDEENLRACSRVLKDVGVELASFEARTDHQEPGAACAGDLVYMDPPYVPASDTANFVGYTKHGFGPEDQKRVARIACDLKARGVHVIVSNSGADEVRELYRGFRIEEVGARRNINSKGNKRGPVTEFIIT